MREGRLHETIHAILSAAKNQGFTFTAASTVGDFIIKTNVVTYLHPDGSKLVCRSNYGAKPTQAFTTISMTIAG